MVSQTLRNNKLLYTSLFKIIESGDYDKEDMRHRVDIFYAGVRIDNEQYQELMGLIVDQPAEEGE